MNARTVLLIGSQDGGRIPFAANELLFKAVCRYPVDAAFAAGCTRLGLILPEGEPGLARCFSPETLGCFRNDPEPLVRAGYFDGDVLLVSDDAVLLDRSHVTALYQHGYGMLCDASQCVAALLPGERALDWLRSGGSADAMGLPRLNIRYYGREQYAGFSAHTKRGLLELSELLRTRILDRWLDFGVTIAARDGVMIGANARIGTDTVILPGTQLRGRVLIGRGCVIGPNTVVTNSIVGDGCVVESSKLTDAILHERVHVGPFADLRPGTELYGDVRVDSFAAMANSRIGSKTHISAHAHVEDTAVGERVQLGCGTVTSSFDGMERHRTRIGSDAFIGDNTTLVAPLTVGADAYTAPGTTVTQDVPAGALAADSARQENKEGWAETFHAAHNEEEKSYK